ncbi:uncharacterized protein A4U43_C01F19040 [Asparagus officinalis]|uniref:Uncharacterized protein n=1 Tax=Asparagus officinalis TaxID=4686 RepID=A0A5P1FQR3_ASPOF|nr:uncharacterized protein A4U43_C01F19040 [Asparagus officinalis]
MKTQSQTPSALLLLLLFLHLLPLPSLSTTSFHFRPQDNYLLSGGPHLPSPLSNPTAHITAPTSHPTPLSLLSSPLSRGRAPPPLPSVLLLGPPVSPYRLTLAPLHRFPTSAELLEPPPRIPLPQPPPPLPPPLAVPALLVSPARALLLTPTASSIAGGEAHVAGRWSTGVNVGRSPAVSAG